MTRVSVLTPFYNITQEQWQISANSINNQTNRDFEWVLVNDGSDDPNRFHPDCDVLLERNYGPGVARNVAFQISSGDIITYLDMGDVLYPNRVENLIKLFDTYKVQLIFSAYDIDSGQGEPYIFDHFNWIGKHPKYPTAFEYAQLLEKQNISVPLGVAHKRKPFVEAGGFQRGIVCGEDGILWRRMIEKIPVNQCMFSDDRAGRYFISENGQSRTQRRFEMGGFAFDGNKKDNGKYLDKEWFENYLSKEYYD